MNSFWMWLEGQGWPGVHAKLDMEAARIVLAEYAKPPREIPPIRLTHWLLLISLCLSGPAWAQDAPPAFAVRLGASVGPDHKAGIAEFLVGSGENKSRTTFTAQRDAAGKIVQKFSTGVEHDLFSVNRCTFSVAGAAGFVYTAGPTSGLASGATTARCRLWHGLSVVVDGLGENAPAVDGEWNGTGRLMLQWER